MAKSVAAARIGSFHFMAARAILSRGYQLAETYVEPGTSATNDRRPEFQRMI